MKNVLFSKVLLFLCLFRGPLSAQVGVNFPSIGSTQTFVIPACISDMTITLKGGAGANVGWGTASGAMVYVVLTPTPGEVLYINCGGIGTGSVGGWNGGGNGGSGVNTFGGGGGGSTDIRIGGNALSNRIIVMGGGGGNGSTPQISGHGGQAGAGLPFFCPPLVGYSNGGAGGNGLNAGGAGGCAGGISILYGSGGAGGGMTSGGGISGAGLGSFGQAGSLAQGGNGGGSTAIYGGTGSGIHGGGGGGGGYYGGAGGMSGNYSSEATFPASGGGGAGSSYINTNYFFNIVPGGIPGSAGGVFIQYTYTSSPVSATGGTALCGSSNVTLTASGASTYTWLPVGDFSGSNTASASHSPSVSTNYTVTGTNTIGCVSSTVLTVNVYTAVPSLSISNTSSASGGICPSQSVTISANGAVTYTWTGGLVPGLAFVPPSGGQTYTVSGSNACGTSSTIVSVSIHPTPTVSGSFGQPTVCAGTAVTLNGGGASSYLWAHPITTISVANGQIFTPTISTTFTIKGTSILGCTNTAVATITVVAYPNLTTSATSSVICMGGFSSLQTAGATNYTWMPGNSNANPFNVTPAATTVYTLTGSNSNCVSTATLSVGVYTLPVVSGMITPTLVCPSDPVVLTGNGATTYTWFSGATIYSGNNLTITPTSTGIYTLAASNGSCSNTATLLVSTYLQTMLTITSPSAICAGESATLTGSGAVTHTWTSSSSVSGTSIAVSPLATTIYTFSGTSGQGCTTSIQHTLLVNQNPTITAVSDKTYVCAGETVSLTASGGQSYQWSANANNAVTAGTTVAPQSSSFYTVTGYDLASGCASSKTVAIGVFSPVLYVIASPTFNCEGDTITLVASGGNPNSYTWTGSSSNGATLQIAPSSSLVYMLSATSSSNQVNCISTLSGSITVYQKPSIIATAERSVICAGETLTLSATGGNTYIWGNSTNGNTIAVSPATSTLYLVKGTDLNGCSRTASIQVNVNGCVGVVQNTFHDGVTIYPNPSIGSFVVRSSLELRLTLFNDCGQIIRVIVLSEGNDYTVPVNDLADGIYFIAGMNAGIPINKKVLVAK